MKYIYIYKVTISYCTFIYLATIFSLLSLFSSNLLDSSLVIVQIASVRVLEAVLGHDRGGLDTVGNQVLTEVEQTLGELGDTLLASLGVLVTRPDKLGEGSSTRPELARDDGVVNLLGPERSLGTDDVLGLGRGQVTLEVVVVDALPGLVGSAPGATTATEVERGSGTGRVGVDVDVVARIVGDVATETAVEVEPVGAGDDDVVSHGGEVGNVGNTVVPGLHDDVLGDLLGMSISGEDNILPHHETTVLVVAVGLGGEDGHGLVDPVLVKVEVGAGLVGGEPVADRLAEVEAAGLELITTNVEDVLGEALGELRVDVLDDIVGLGVDHVELTRVGLHSGVQRPVVVGPPGVLAGDDALVDLLPSGGRVAGHVDLGDDTNTASAAVGNNVGDIVGRELLSGRVSVLGHLRVGAELHGPRLGVGYVPVEDIELGESKTVNLLLDLGDGDEVSGGIDHDTTVGVLGTILDGDGLLDLQAIAAIRDDELLEGGESVQSTPDSLGGDINLARLSAESVALVNTVLQVGIAVGDGDLDSAYGATVTAVPVPLGLGTGGIRECLEFGNRRFNGLWCPLQGGDGVVGAGPSIRKSLGVRSLAGGLEVELADGERAGAAKLDAHWLRERVDLDGINSRSQGNERKRLVSHFRRNVSRLEAGYSRIFF